MAGRKVYHVTPADNGDWRVQAQGAQRASNVVENKSEAINRARELAQKHTLSQVVIHDQTGKIQTEYTYGKDPERYKG
jgi:uncharacterized protein YdaT